MKFLLFVEGSTEREALPDFLKQWIDSALKLPVGISMVKFDGVGNYLNGIKKRVHLLMSGHKHNEIIAAVGLLDLYGAPIFPPKLKRAEKPVWGKRYLESLVSHKKFTQHFAVHETEAWLLADDVVLPRNVRKLLPSTCKKPESVNENEPPSKLLDRLYRKSLNRGYRKTVDGGNLFLKCSPETVAFKCPYFQNFLADLEQRARAALQKND